MKPAHFTLAAAIVVAAALLGTAPRAQDRSPAVSTPQTSVQDALLRPFSWPFAKDATLEQVAAHLRQQLNAPVVLDLAALQRAEITPESTVRLQLDGVRLQTGLKLLLDQVGLTFKVVPEDNLLILTDREGSADPLDAIRTELESLHHDLHELRDAVEDVYAAVAPEDDEPAPEMRKPTLIQDLSPDDAKAPITSRPGL